MVTSDDIKREVFWVKDTKINGPLVEVKKGQAGILLSATHIHWVPADECVLKKIL